MMSDINNALILSHTSATNDPPNSSHKYDFYMRYIANASNDRIINIISIAMVNVDSYNFIAETLVLYCDVERIISLLCSVFSMPDFYTAIIHYAFYYDKQLLIKYCIQNLPIAPLCDTLGRNIDIRLIHFVEKLHLPKSEWLSFVDEFVKYNECNKSKLSDKVCIELLGKLSDSILNYYNIHNKPLSIVQYIDSRINFHYDRYNSLVIYSSCQDVKHYAAQKIHRLNLSIEAYRPWTYDASFMQFISDSIDKPYQYHLNGDKSMTPITIKTLLQEFPHLRQYHHERQQKKFALSHTLNQMFMYGLAYYDINLTQIIVNYAV